MALTEKTYYLYDPKTYKFSGYATSTFPPEDSTEKPLVATLNGVDYPLDENTAVFNPETQTWTGTNASYSTQVTIAALTTQVGNLTALVTGLQSQVASLTAAKEA